MSTGSGALGALAGFLGRCQKVVGLKSEQNSGRIFCGVLFVCLTLLLILPSGSLTPDFSMIDNAQCCCW